MIFERVTKIEHVGACRYTGYVARSLRLTLECGHQRTQKASQYVGQFARCRECERKVADYLRKVRIEYDALNKT